jgi:hypothetical protein
MAEYLLTTTPVSPETCYPAQVQTLVNFVADASTLVVDGNEQAYVVSQTPPASGDTDKLWFETGTPATNYGTPKVARAYVNGAWQEFAQLSQGDRILVIANATISAPWGEHGYTYSFSGLGLSNYAPTIAPVPPEGLKYKTYVGYWSSKTP